MSVAPAVDGLIEVELSSDRESRCWAFALVADGYAPLLLVV